MIRAKVADFDLDTQTLRLFDPKGKRKAPREHLLPLGPKASAIFEQLAERARKQEKDAAQKNGREPVYSNLWLFSSHGKSQLMHTTPGKRAADISKAMKGEPFDLRVIRRTCEILASMGISRDTRAKLLSHGLSGVQATHYDRHGYIDEKRAALIAWETRLDKIATGKKADNVVNLREKRGATQ